MKIPWRKHEPHDDGLGEPHYSSQVPNVAGEYHLWPGTNPGSYGVTFMPAPLSLGEAPTLAEAQALAQRHYDAGGIAKFVKP
jgi:hypothetical protein